MQLRKSEARGHADHGWLKSYHTFSFASYRDPEHMGYRALRVLNDDTVAPGGGFGRHPHRDMEIVTYVVKGALEHKDSLGSGSVLYAGDVQRMSAGTGVEHSEFNHSDKEELKFIQIWIHPTEKGLTPSYEELSLELDSKRNEFVSIASPESGVGMHIHADVGIYAANLDAGSQISLPGQTGRFFWLQVVNGEVEVAGEKLSTGDGLYGEFSSQELTAVPQAEVLFFDLA